MKDISQVLSTSVETPFVCCENKDYGGLIRISHGDFTIVERLIIDIV